MKLRWGLIGCGDISNKRVAPAIVDLENSEFVSVARANFSAVIANPMVSAQAPPLPEGCSRAQFGLIIQVLGKEEGFIQLLFVIRVANTADETEGVAYVPGHLGERRPGSAVLLEGADGGCIQHGGLAQAGGDNVDTAVVIQVFVLIIEARQVFDSAAGG